VFSQNCRFSVIYRAIGNVPQEPIRAKGELFPYLLDPMPAEFQVRVATGAHLIQNQQTILVHLTLNRHWL
jgi:hypothetical protein